MRGYLKMSENFGEWDNAFAWKELAKAQGLARELAEAWEKSWDCSRYPGHGPMNEALAKAKEAGLI